MTGRNQDGWDWYAVAGFVMPILLSAIAVAAVIIFAVHALT